MTLDFTTSPATAWVADAELRQLLIDRTATVSLTADGRTMTIQVIIDDVTAARGTVSLGTAPAKTPLAMTGPPRTAAKSAAETPDIPGDGG